MPFRNTPPKHIAELTEQGSVIDLPYFDTARSTSTGSNHGCVEPLELAGMVDDPSLIESPAGRHVSMCLKCQAELARYRSLRNELAGLRNHMVSPDESLLREVLDAVRPLASVHKLHPKVNRSRKAAYIGGIAAATGAAAGALVVASRMAARQRVAG